MPRRSPRAPVHAYRAPARIDLAGGTLDIFPISQLEPDAVTVNLLPISVEPLHTQLHYTRSKVRNFSWLYAQQKPTVCSQQSQAATAQIIAPADPLITCLQVVSRRTPANQPYPFPVILRHVPDHLSGYATAVKVMLGLDQLVES